MSADQLCNYCQHNDCCCELCWDSDEVACKITNTMREPIKMKSWMQKLPMWIIRLCLCKHFLINPDEEGIP